MTHTEQELEKIPSGWTWCGKKRHLVGEIQDGHTKLVIYKHWLEGKRRWEYKAEPRYIIELELKMLARGE